MAEPFERVETFFEDDCLGGHCSSSGELLFFEVVEDFFAFFFGFVGKEEGAVSLKILHGIYDTSVMW